MATADLGFFLSGGSANLNPDESLGGPPSSTPIDDLINNLFSDVTGDQVADGYTDYRCFYVVNDSTSTYSNVKLWLDFEYPDGSNTQLGATIANEIQTMAFNDYPQGGTFKINLDGYITDDINYSDVSATMASNTQTALRNLPNAQEATVTVLGVDYFQITFSGQNSNHKYPLMILVDNNLTPQSGGEQPTVTFVETQVGSPINLIAVDIGDPTTPPTGIVFSEPTEVAPYTIGVIKPTEVFAIWLQRITDPETEPVSLDGLRIKINADLQLN